MSVKIRLQRFGRKQSAYYHIVVADGRSPRDGKFIERIGDYNPNTNPATINLEFNKAVQWLENGAQPTDTCRAILSYKGVMYKHHLNRGVAKGALTAELAETKLNKWLEEKNAKITAKADSLLSSADKKKKAALEAEAKVNEERTKKLAAKQSALAAEVAAAETAAEETPAAEETAAE
ncbi:MAG: 30S ribosomal protein S16 [Bacteroidia bacterium]|nr:30S ribosomal protein S16 [Bacteroidia bacterium]